MEMKSFLRNYGWVIFLLIILIIVLTFVISSIRMNQKIGSEINKLAILSKESESSVIREEDLNGLPNPVQKWLRNTGVVGHEKIRSVSFSQEGDMKLKPEQSYTKAQAKQYINVENPGYLWEVDLPILPIINTKGRDLFLNGKGAMEIRIGSLIPVVDEKNNDKLDESSMHRFLLELPWYPTAALEEYMRWEEIDENSAKAILTYNEQTVEAIFYFNEGGTLQRQEALRFKETHEGAKRLRCIGEVKGYTNVEGINLPNQYNITWMIEGKAFTWYKFKNYNIVFNDIPS